MFRNRVFCPDPDQTFFSESGSGSAKKLDSIRKNPDPDPWKKRPKTGEIVGKKCYISYLALLTLFFFCQAPPKPYQNHHLDHISLLMDGSGLLKPGSGLAKKPGSIRIRIWIWIRNTGFYAPMIFKNCYMTNFYTGRYRYQLMVEFESEFLLRSGS